MSAQIAIDFDAATAERDLGIQRSADRADRVECQWTGQAIGLLRAYLETRPGTFLAETFRAWAHAHGLPLPPDARAFGAVVQRAAHRKAPLIRRAGYGPAASSHCSPKPLWEDARLPQREA